jgi:hypothetical protein
MLYTLMHIYTGMHLSCVEEFYSSLEVYAYITNVHHTTGAIQTDSVVDPDPMDSSVIFHLDPDPYYLSKISEKIQYFIIFFDFLSI